MSWFRKVLVHRDPPTDAPVPYSRPSPELLAAQRRHRELLSRADAAIKEAMDHADEMFEQQPYRGPDRRAT